jgi:hypothetical protein
VIYPALKEMLEDAERYRVFWDNPGFRVCYPDSWLKYLMDIIKIRQRVIDHPNICNVHKVWIGGRG